MRVKSVRPYALHKMTPPFSLEHSGHAMNGYTKIPPAMHSSLRQTYHLGGIADWWTNMTTGKLSTDQRVDAIDQCAADNYRAGGGRITMAEARQACAKDINAVVGINDREADHAHSMTALYVAGVFLAGLWIVTRR
jgi:hypothetical protein